MAKLTVRAIEAARPRATPYKLTVDTGLYIRVAANGEKRWLVKYVVDGKQREARLPKPYGSGGEGFMGLADATAENARIQSLARSGLDFQQQAADALAKERQAAEQLRATLLPFADMFEAWLATGVRRTDNNAELRRSFQKDVIPAVGNKPVKDLTEHDLRKVLAAIVQRGRNRMAVRVYRDLVQLFTWAEKRKPWRELLIEQNPAELLEIEKIVAPDYDINDERERVLSPDELRELQCIFHDMHEARKNAKDKRAISHGLKRESQIAVWICLSTLCRIGELLMAEWTHVDTETGVWRIPKENTKQTNAKQQDHIVYLSAFALRQFRALKALQGDRIGRWCFPARNPKKSNDAEDSHVCLKSVSKQIGDRQTRFKDRKALKNRTNDDTLVLAKGVNGEWTPHDLRRTGATMMQRAGIGLDIIDRCQNHVLGGSKVRRAYLHHDYAPEKRVAWDLLSQKIDEALGVQGYTEEASHEA